MEKDSKCMIFLVCLHFSIISSLYSNVILKPRQVICLEKMFLGVDTLAVLPTGYGKSLIYQLLPFMLFAKKVLEENPTKRLDSINDVTSVLLVISPLNSLINDQIQKLVATGLRVSALNIFKRVSSDDSEEIECDVTEQEKKEQFVSGYYNILFAHPEALISSKFGRGLIYSALYQQHVCALVIDEAHCILEWYGILLIYVIYIMTPLFKHL